MDEISRYQKYCWDTYKPHLGLEGYRYGYGNPVKVHVPVDTSTGGVMIVGAYPTAHFHTIDHLQDVPIEDHLYPFSDECYFDGVRLRRVQSGEEITQHYLKPLEISRESCWITNLVKVFLFKEGHIRRYKELGFQGPFALRDHFKDYARKSLSYLKTEIQLAKPAIILLLGTEVTAIVLGVSDQRARALMTPAPVPYSPDYCDVPCFALPHPGIIMRNTEGGRKWKRILKMQLEAIRTGYLS